MSLDEKTRSKIAHPNNPNENFDHMRIECRAKDKIHYHDTFAEELFHKMRTVTSDHFLHQIFLLQISFEGYTGHIAFNESGERVNYTLNIYQVTMNKLPRNVIDRKDSIRIYSLSFSRWEISRMIIL